MLSVLAFLLFAPLEARNLEVMIGKSAETEITFLENYAIVINNNHYYGPISKDIPLKVDNFDDYSVRLQLKYKENGKEKYRSLGYTSAPILIVREFKNKVDFEKTVPPEKLKSKKISISDINLYKEVKKKTPFFRYKNEAFSGWIEFTGPLSILVRKQSKNKFYLVETVNLEDYLVHVTNCEMRVASNKEAYKAQSILSRTFVFNKIMERVYSNNPNKDNWSDFQLLPDERDQAYICEMRVKNNTPPSKAVKEAVKETENQLLFDRQGQLTKVHYCAYCGDCAYCKMTNHCRTENGLGCCQNGIAYYTNKKGYSHKQVLREYYPNSAIFSYTDDVKTALNNIPDKMEFDINLSEIEQRLKQMI